MSYPRHALSGATPGFASTQWTVRRRTMPAVETRPTRRYSVQWIDQTGTHDEFTRLAPAIPLFEDAFSAFGRGTLIPTIDGPVAIEDLSPGALIETATGLAPLMWIGSISIVPQSAAQDTSNLRLYRVAADSFGLDRPMPDLLLGPGARLVNRGSSVSDTLGTEAVLESIVPMTDGMSVIEVRPLSTVQLFHLGFQSHRTVLANGVEMESMHPGAINPNRIDAPTLALFLSLFPHMRHPTDFGRLAMPRVGPEGREDVHAA